MSDLSQSDDISNRIFVRTFHRSPKIRIISRAFYNRRERSFYILCLSVRMIKPLNKKKKKILKTILHNTVRSVSGVNIYRSKYAYKSYVSRGLTKSRAVGW